MVPGPGEDVVRVSPDKVRGFAVAIYNMDVRAVRFGGEHSRAETPQTRGTPAVQKDKSRAVGIKEQMIKIVFCVFGVAGNLAEPGDVRDGDYQIPPAGFKVDSENA